MGYPQQTDPVLSAGLDIQLAINGVKSSVDKLCELNGKKLYVPQRVPLVNVKAVTSGSLTVIDLGSPPQGQQWMVHNVLVSDASVITTNITGVTDIHLYVGSPGAFSPGGCVWGPMTQGTVYTFGDKPIKVIPGDHLFAVLTGATTTGQVVMFKADIEQYVPGTGREVSGL